MRPFRASVLFFAFLSLSLLSTLTFAVQPDRIAGAIDSGAVVRLKGNVHGLARRDFDLGRVHGAEPMSGVSLVFKPSAAQQAALDKLLKEQQQRSSPNYHKWLTPAQFADRFGMSRSDIEKVTAWLQSQGFTVTRVANSRNQVFFEGTVAQVESAFRTEIHSYLVDGKVHFANATEPSVPAVLSGMTIGVQHLHNFQPKPRVNVRTEMAMGVEPRFTSSISGNHFLVPDDFATIYDLQAFYSAGVDGAGQTIAVIGQSAINLTDIHHFRTAANLPTNDPSLVLVPGSGNSTVCAGDEGESDLDLEWTGGIAKNAGIIFVYAGPGTGRTCDTRTWGAFDALQYSVDQNIAGFISSSYGNCEANIGSSFANSMQLSAQQANSQGQTIISASGDSGAADCDFRVSTATHGFAVDIPAAIPEVTGAGGSEFNEGNGSYWSSTNNADSGSALSYIPEIAWNDTSLDPNISASGGGASIYFSKPSWQVGVGVPADTKRHVPDISASASADHDGYLFCTEDGAPLPTCTNGFRASDQSLAVVGGTSAGAPTLSATMALVNQYLGNIPPFGGLGNINPKLYQLAASHPLAFNDVTTGDNIVPCTQGTTNCPASSPFQYGFTAGVGYDQVTGLGSINAFELALAWAATLLPTTTTVSSSASQPFEGQSVTLTANVTPLAAKSAGYVNFYNGTAFLNTVPLDMNGVAKLDTTSLPHATNSITASYAGNGTYLNSTSSPVTVTVVPAFTLAPGVATITMVQGGTDSSATVAVTRASGFTDALTFTCSSPASESTCTVNPSGATTQNSVSLTVTTRAPTAQLRRPLDRGTQIFYAVLLPGVLGILLAGGSSNRARHAMRMLALIGVLGFSTLWMGACGGGSKPKDPGTPKGNYTLTIKGTTSGSSPASGSTTIQLQVN